VLESERLTLRPVRAADAETLWTIWNDREVYRYVGHLAYGDVPGLDRIQRAAGPFEGLWAEQAWGPMTVTRRADGAVVGECGLYPVFDEQGVATTEIELGHRYASTGTARGLPCRPDVVLTGPAAGRRTSLPLQPRQGNLAR